MIILDTETTGLVGAELIPIEQQPHIIEIAAVRLDDKSLKELSRIDTFINPGVPIPPERTKDNGISDADVANAPSFARYLPKLVDFFLGERSMLAHNIEFDASMLRIELSRLGKLTQFPWPQKHICTVEAAKEGYGKPMRLEVLYEHLFEKKANQKHRAMPDVEILTECVRRMRKDGVL